MVSGAIADRPAASVIAIPRFLTIVSIDAKESILRIHIIPFIGGKRLDEVTDEVIATLKSKWIAGGYTDARGREVKGTSERKTLNNRLTVLGTMLKLAVEWKRIPAMPCTVRLLKVDEGREADFYDHSTYEVLVEASAKTDPRHHAAVLLAGDGGLRRGEIIGLNVEDIDLRGGRITIRRSVYWKKKKRYEDVVKGGTTKPVPCTPRLLAALKACRHLRGGRLLYTDEGRELTPKIIKRWMMVVERRAGLPVTGRLHAYRHTFCSHLAMAGVPARTIQELARHESLTTTLRYMHLSPNAKEEGIAMLTASRAEGGKPVAIRGTGLALGSEKQRNG
jgi:integrase